MKIKFILFSFLLTVSFFQSIVGQCKLKIVKDEFTAKTRITTKVIKMISVFPMNSSKDPWDLSMYLCIEEGNSQIIAVHHVYGVASKIDVLFFKFANDLIIRKIGPASTWEWEEGLHYYQASKFLITKQELIQFSMLDLDKIRVEFSYFNEAPVVDKALKKGVIEDFKKEATCLLTQYGETIKNKDVAIINEQQPAPKPMVKQNTAATPTNAPADLLKKWHIKLQKQDKEGKTVDYEMTKEFFSNNEVEINTGKNIVKGKYDVANGGKYIITNLEGQVADISEIVSLDPKTLIIKGSNGKLYIYTSE